MISNRLAVRVLVGSFALATLLLALSAGPASAHAILLRTDPSPQSTVSHPPRIVRLTFTEPVEVSFGAVRVFDVDAHRVDSGDVATSVGGRELDVAVRNLTGGTYTVTWRVLSADGHSVHGGFSFYVGAPSAISAVAVRAEAGAGRVVGWGFGVARFVWFCGLFALAGGVVFRRWVWTPIVRASHLSGSPLWASFRAASRSMLLTAWAALFVAGMASLAFEAASVSGLSLARSVQPNVLNQVLRTAYGRYWMASAVLTLVALVPTAALSRRRHLLGVNPDTWVGLLLVSSAGLAASAALSGHARTLPHPVLGVASVSLHLMAVAFWVGGLVSLLAAVRATRRSLDEARAKPIVAALIRRFGRLAAVAAITVTATGAANAWLDMAHPSDLWQTTHGTVISLKIVLLACALVLAARHRWSSPAGISRNAGPGLRRFARSLGLETVVLVVAIGLAAGLVALVPGRSLALAANGPVNEELHSHGYTVQVFLDPSRVGANQVHVTFVNQQGLGAAEIQNAAASISSVQITTSPVELRLLSPGHFVGDLDLPAAGRYKLMVTSGSIVARFSFAISTTQRSRG